MSDQEVMISQNEIIEHDKKFIISSYNSIEIIIDTATGYINATKLCNGQGKDFRTFCKSIRFNELNKLFDSKNNPEQKCSSLKYELKSQFSPLIRGQYIHPSYINFVCEWCSLSYAVKVAKIMNTINEEVHIRNISLQTEMDEMGAEVERLKSENKDLCSPINRLRGGYIYILKTDEVNIYKIYCRSVKLVNKANVVKEFKLTNYDDVRKILHKNIPYLRGIIDYIGFGKYEIMYLNLVEDIINEIKNNTFYIENYVDNTITFNKEFEKVKEWCMSSKNRNIFNCRCSKLYEYYFASSNPNFKLWKYSSQSFRNVYNEICSDCGIDVIDEEGRGFYQLKYYPHRNLQDIAIESFVNFISNFSYDNGDNVTYSYNLVIPSSCVIDDFLLREIEENNINIIRFDPTDMYKFIESYVKSVVQQATSHLSVKNPQEKTMEYVEFIKSVYDNRKNNNITKRMLAQMINEKYGTSYEKSAISHYQKILFDKYPEYKDVWINENKQQNLITQFIKDHWLEEDTQIKDGIFKQFNYEISTHSIDTRRRSIKASTTEELPLKPTEVRKNTNDMIKEWLIRPENWYQTDEWKIQHIKEIFNVDKSVSAIRHYSSRLLEKYADGVRVINPKTGEEELIHLCSSYKKAIHEQINDYVKEHGEMTNQELKLKIKELFNYEITDKGLKSRRLRYRNPVEKENNN